MNSLYSSICVLAVSAFFYVDLVSSSVTTFGELNDKLIEFQDPIDEKFKAVKKRLDETLTNTVRGSLTSSLKDFKLCQQTQDNSDLNLFIMYHEIAKNCTEASLNHLEDRKDEFVAKLTNIVVHEAAVIKSESQKLCMGDKYTDIFSWSETFPCAQDPTETYETGFKDLYGKFDAIDSESIIKDLDKDQENLLKVCFTKRAFQKWIKQRKSMFNSLCAY